MPAIDNFANFLNSLTGPLVDGFSITPNDNNDLIYTTRALMVTVAGNVAVIMKGGATITLPGLLPGVIYPVRVSRVLELAAGTTASGVVGLY